jgi:hypothetical protein
MDRSVEDLLCGTRRLSYAAAFFLQTEAPASSLRSGLHRPWTKRQGVTAMEDRRTEEGFAALNRQLNARHKDLQDQILELSAELRKVRLAAYGSLLASLIALFLASGQWILASGQWIAGAIFVALFTAYAIFTWGLRKTERASRGDS